MEFRRLTAADLPLAMGMNTAFRADLVTHEGGAAFLADARNWLFAAIDEGSVIGFAYGCEVQRPNGSKCLYIHEVGVTAARQRQGVGMAMMEALKGACRAQGIPKLFLYTDQANEGANALYRRTGGKVGWDSRGNDRAYWFTL